MLRPDNYVQAPFTPVAVKGNVHIAIAAGDGGITGANWNAFGGTQGSWQGTDWWKGAIVGGIVGAGTGLAFSTAIGASGIYTAAGTTTKAYALASKAIMAGNMNMMSSMVSNNGRGSWDDAWRSGVVGLASGLTFGTLNGPLSAKAAGAISGGVEGLANGSIQVAQQGLTGKEAAKRIGISTSLGIARGYAIGHLYDQVEMGSELGTTRVQTHTYGTKPPFNIYTDNLFHIKATDFTVYSAGYLVTEGIDYIFSSR